MLVRTIKRTANEVVEVSKELFNGEITLKKSEFVLAGIVIVLLGVIIGMAIAPLTHGFHFSIGSNNRNNGSGNGNSYGDGCAITNGPGPRKQG